MENRPRIVFFGTPEFAVASLDAITKAGVPVAGVVTASDKPAGRGLNLSHSAVKQYALSHNLPFLQPEKLKDPEFLLALTELRPDIQVVVAFRMLPEEVWNLPPMGTFNLHASLLPHYRGAAPINRVIMNGEEVTGVTTFFIDEKIDTGAILLQESLKIGPHETAGELHDRLMMLGAELVVKTVQAICDGLVESTPQEELILQSGTLMSAPKLQKRDAIIQWDRDTGSVYNQIRGLTPFPGAYSKIVLKDGSTLPLKIGSVRIAADLAPAQVVPGTTFTDRKQFLRMNTRDGMIEILELQPASKKMMNIHDFLNGFGRQLA
ncbi:MAG: methionyl-tRNA formyltransferase [Bacteroidetes bacterium]|nr:MAG: methionyl-tRNA formyltransferase [Bacteroidota bacterium]